MPRLVILNGEFEDHAFAMDKPSVSVGRRADNDVCIRSDPRISRYHARLSRLGEDWFLDDAGSANGTFVGQRRIHSPTLVRPGDRFRMGYTWFTIAEDPGERAAAASRVRLLEQRDKNGAESRLRVMNRISSAMSATLDLDRLLDVILESIMELIPAERGVVMLVDRESGEFVPRAVRHRDPTQQETDVSLSRHILEYTINYRVAILTADAMTDERFGDLDSVQNLQIRSAACAPLLHGEEALGTIYLDSSSSSHAFSQDDLEVLTAVAGQVVTAIENARLYTDLRQAYESLQDAQEHLLRAERLTTIGALSASIAHDMANILTPLKPLVQIVQRGNENVDREASEALDRQLNRLTALLERIMSFSRLSALKLKPVQVNDVIESTLSLVVSELRHRHVEVTTDLAPQLPLIMADTDNLDRVFLNICLNAMEALEGVQEPALTITSRHDGDEVVISFTDNGPGIPEQQQSRLFEPLYTTKQSGTGLGLYSCKRIVEEHGGSIEVDSIEGQGATFTVRLPVGKTEQAQA